MFYSELVKQVRYFKETEGGQQKVCKALEDVRAIEGIEVFQIICCDSRTIQSEVASDNGYI